MTVHRKRFTILLLVALGLVLLIGIGLPAIPPTVRSDWLAECCSRCGILRYTTTDLHIRSGKQLQFREHPEETDLSEYYMRHFEEACTHKWKRFHSERSGYIPILGLVKWRAGATESGGRSTPDLVDLSEKELAILDGLFRSDPKECKDFIRRRLSEDLGGPE